MFGFKNKFGVSFSRKRFSGIYRDKRGIAQNTGNLTTRGLAERIIRRLNHQFTYPRWFFNSNLFFTVNKYLFTIHYDHNLATYRPLPIDYYYYYYYYYYSISTGINIKF
jgi:hypothetical protein